jgi:hypothetical protein
VVVCGVSRNSIQEVTRTAASAMPPGQRIRVRSDGA